jgi:hypothetical protein
VSIQSNFSIRVTWIPCKPMQKLKLTKYHLNCLNRQQGKAGCMELMNWYNNLFSTKGNESYSHAKIIRASCPTRWPLCESSIWFEFCIYLSTSAFPCYLVNLPCYFNYLFFNMFKNRNGLYWLILSLASRIMPNVVQSL